jgi:hypothetical protein
LRLFVEKFALSRVFFAQVQLISSQTCSWFTTLVMVRVIPLNASWPLINSTIRSAASINECTLSSIFDIRIALLMFIMCDVQATARGEEGMTLFFVCCNPNCGHRWRD